MILFFIRHADPVYSPDSLTPLGSRQAESLAKRLSLYGLDEIYASSSNRAIMTAGPTCELLKKEAVILDWCNEGHAWKELTVTDENGNRMWGFQNAQTVKDFASDEVVKLGAEWYDHPRFKNTSFKEGIKRIKGETDKFMASLGYLHMQNSYRTEMPDDNRRVALFAHQGFGLAFLSSLLDIPYPLFCTHFDISHSGMTAIEFKSNNGFVVPQILQLSNDSHLYKDGLPTKYQNRIYF